MDVEMKFKSLCRLVRHELFCLKTESACLPFVVIR